MDKTMNFLSLAHGSDGQYGVALRAGSLNPMFDIYSLDGKGGYVRVNRKAFGSKCSAEAAASKMAAGGVN